MPPHCFPSPPLLILHGGADASVTMDDVAALSRELDAAKVPYEIQVYAGAPHGFTVWDTERYRKDADEKSWAAVHPLPRHAASELTSRLSLPGSTGQSSID